MLDQVAYLKSIGLNAAAVYNGQDEKVLKDVEEGLFSHIYATPGPMLSARRCQKMLQSAHFYREWCRCCHGRGSLHQSMVSL